MTADRDAVGRGEIRPHGISVRRVSGPQFATGCVRLCSTSSELKVGELAALSCSYEENCAVDEALGGKKERTAVSEWGGGGGDEILEGIKDCKILYRSWWR